MCCGVVLVSTGFCILYSSAVAVNPCTDVFLHVGIITDLQILGCELHQNAFDAPPGPTVEAIVLPQTIAVITGRGGRGTIKPSIYI